jgi:pantothenate synthetase
MVKEKIQNKINQIKELAIASKVKVEVKEESVHRNNDNLSKSIRNDKEAKLFYSELKSAISLAKG